MYNEKSVCGLLLSACIGTEEVAVFHFINLLEFQ